MRVLGVVGLVVSVYTVRVLRGVYTCGMAKRFVTVRLDEELLARVDGLPGTRTAAIERGLGLVLAEAAGSSVPRARSVPRPASGRVVGRLVDPKAGVMPIPKRGA